MKYLVGILIIFYVGCKSDTSKKQVLSKSERFNDALILNIALSDPDLDAPYSSSDTGYAWARKKILDDPKIVSDSALNISMRLYDWTYNGGQSFPKKIIYVNDNKGFEYAFAFRDEYYFWLIKNNATMNEELLSEYNSKMNFENQLNLIINKLKFNRQYNADKLIRFEQLFLDSLLGMKRILAKDTIELKENYNEIIPRLSDTICIDSLNSNLKRILQSLKKDKNKRFYFPSERGNSFWQFETIKWKEPITGETLFKIKPTFLNQECYVIWYW